MAAHHDTENGSPPLQTWTLTSYRNLTSPFPEKGLSLLVFHVSLQGTLWQERIRTWRSSDAAQMGATVFSQSGGLQMA